MSPVEMPPIPTVPAPLPSTVRLPVPEMAVPDTFSELTAADDSEPPVMVAPLMVLRTVSTPAVETLKLLEEIVIAALELPMVMAAA